MELVMSGLTYDICLVYLDDIIIDFPNLGSTYNGGWCLATY